ncbi:MAG: hypothetical protein ATN35_11600 [Epulopiscium sp. Nele67-Bin004]|nr:MAG: hypothetical protein ATN35_11600 [Epulopiscium sp. Nele67-Bin004]
MEFQNAIDTFIKSLKFTQLSPNTIVAYEKDLNQCKTIIDCEKLDDISYEYIQNYFIALSDLGLKVGTLKRKRAVLHRFLKFSYNRGLCEERLFELIDPIRAPKSNAPKNILSAEEIKTIFSYIDKNINSHKNFSMWSTQEQYIYYFWLRGELLINILLYSGCRAGEVVSIKKRYVDMQNKKIVILAKGNKYNEVPMHINLVEAFERYFMRIEMICEIIESLDKSEYLFPSRINEMTHMSKRTLHDFMATLSEVIGRPIHTHLFRHTFASFCIASNMDITTLSTIISHSSPAITLSVYTHEISANQKKKEIEKLKFDF